MGDRPRQLEAHITPAKKGASLYIEPAQKARETCINPKVTVRRVEPEGLRSSPLPAVDPGPPREVDDAELIARLSGREGRHHGGGARRDALVTHSARKRPPGRPPPPHPLSCCSHCAAILEYWAFRLRCPRWDCKLGGRPQ